MRNIRFISLALVILIVGSGAAWFFWVQGHNQQNSIENNGLPSQAQRAAVLAIIPLPTADNSNLYTLRNSQFQNLANFPQASERAVTSMIAHLLPPLTSDFQPSVADVQSIRSIYIDPLQLANAMQPADPQMINWLQNRHDELINKQNVSDDDRKTLAEILSHTQLSWFQLYELCETYNSTTADSYGDITKYTYDMSTGDYQTAAVFAAEVVKRVHEALTNYVPGAAEAQPMLLAIEYIKGSFWDVIDTSGTGSLNRNCIDALFTLSTDLIHWVKPGDPLLAEALQHAKISLIETLYLRGDMDQAITTGEKFDQSQMNNEEKTGIAWALALPLYYGQHYVNAATQLAICADDSTFKYSAQAWPMLINALCRPPRRSGGREGEEEKVARCLANVPDCWLQQSCTPLLQHLPLCCIMCLGFVFRPSEYRGASRRRHERWHIYW